MSIIVLPSNTTHFLQPLDQLPFQTLKARLNKEISSLKDSISKWDVPAILNNALYYAHAPAQIQTAFGIAGLPFKEKKI